MQSSRLQRDAFVTAGVEEERGRRDFILFNMPVHIPRGRRICGLHLFYMALSFIINIKASRVNVSPRPVGRLPFVDFLTIQNFHAAKKC